MSRFQQFATAAVLSTALASSAFAASSIQHAAGIAANAEGGSMPRVSVTATLQAMDYTGVVPAANADGLPAWTPESARDYTGATATPTEALLSLAPVWNAMLVHEFLAQ